MDTAIFALGTNGKSGPNTLEPDLRTVEIRDVRGFFIIKDKAPVKESLTIIGTIKTGEKTLSVTEELVLGIALNEGVSVAQPSIDQFTVLN